MEKTDSNAQLKVNDTLYTKEPDGLIQKWYVWSMRGDRFAVASTRNARLSAYKAYFSLADIGRIIYRTRQEAMHAPAKEAAT
jgi:hypothetical protein